MGWKMASAEKTSIRRRKDKRRELCSAWEGPGADEGTDDNRMLYDFQRAKPRLQFKCPHVDEKSIVLSSHLLGQRFWTSEPHKNDEEKRRLNTPRETRPSEPEPPAAPAETCSSERVTTDTKITTDCSTHKPNIIHCPRESKRNLRSILRDHPAPRVHLMEDPGVRRGHVDHRSTEEPLWKLLSAKRVELCHESSARLASPPNNDSCANRRKPVIHKMSRIIPKTEKGSVGQIYSPSLIPKGLHGEDTKVLGPPVHRSDQTLYSCFWSAMKAEEGRQGKKIEQKDKRQQLNSDFSIDCSNVSCLSDLLCPPEFPGKDDPSVRNVTLFHILQVLQSKPGALPQVVVHRRLRTLSGLKVEQFKSELPGSKLPVATGRLGATLDSRMHDPSHCSAGPKPG